MGSPQTLDTATSALQLGTARLAVIGEDARTLKLISETNRAIEAAGRRLWREPRSGREAALGLLRRFSTAATVLESLGCSTAQIREYLEPSRQVFATSCFFRRCQDWPRGYAGDFETVEYLAGGVNRSLPGTLGWHFEDILLHSPIVCQHRNKLATQSRQITSTIVRNNAARVLSIACGGCLDWLPVLPCLESFAGEIVLNDREPAALQLAESRLKLATGNYRLAPGNVLRIAKRLGRGRRFDAVIAGGLFDYLTAETFLLLLRVVSHELLAPGGAFLFTNIAAGNPWRTLMEYGANWKLIERSETHIRELCREAGVPAENVFLEREDAGLTFIVTIVMPREASPAASLPPESCGQGAPGAVHSNPPLIDDATDRPWESP